MEQRASVRELKGVGEKSAKCYAKLGIVSVEDLLRHFPRAYERFAIPKPIGELSEGEVCAIEGMPIATPKLVQTKRAKLLVCHVKDSTGSVVLKWFNQPYLRGRLSMGTHAIFRGKIVRDGGVFSMVQPEIYSPEQYRPLLRSLRPIYNLTEGITGNAIAKAVRQALSVTEIEDVLPAGMRKEYRLMRLADAFEAVHFPRDEEVTKEAVRRLAFDEFFRFLLSVRAMRQTVLATPNHFPVMKNALAERMLRNLSYELTNAQTRVIGEMLSDMQGGVPMQRLLQGDVGSGKTVVALYALIVCAENGYQGCLMAPTEVLATQHYEEFQRILTPLGIRVGLLTGSMSTGEKRCVRENTENGELQIVVGTHTLFQESVVFRNLGLVVVDEQHRFGVKQRERLQQKGETPHLLIMSATPIPRTLAMMLYGDMDLSLLDEMPKNRLLIKSCVVDTGYRATAYRFIQQKISVGQQVYVICPLIEESEGMEGENVKDYAERLREEFPQAKIALLHGRMSAVEKNATMRAFAMHETDILVSTTVIEVGINVPNATVIMIENAERFGLAGLHQLRGRVGRGEEQSYCILVQGSGGEESKARLEVLLKTTDGFQIAEEDLRLRGPGDFFGIRQSGDMDFGIADLIRDAGALRDAKEAVDKLSDKDFQKIHSLSVAGEGISVVY